MIQVGVSERHGVQARGFEARIVPISLAQLLVALKEPAVDQRSLACVLQQIARAGDCARRAEEPEPGRRSALRRARFAHSFAPCTVSTGMLDRRTTFSATLPRSARSSPCRPCVPITIKSALDSVAAASTCSQATPA